jgi:hypothetical protein
MILICSLYQLNLYVCIYADNLETRAYTHTDRDTERERESKQSYYNIHETKI